MIEWINNTVTLKDFICESFPGGKVSGINKMLVYVETFYTSIILFSITYLSKNRKNSYNCII